MNILNIFLFLNHKSKFCFLINVFIFFTRILALYRRFIIFITKICTKLVHRVLNDPRKRETSFHLETNLFKNFINSVRSFEFVKFQKKSTLVCSKRTKRSSKKDRLLYLIIFFTKLYKYFKNRRFFEIQSSFNVLLDNTYTVEDTKSINNF